MPDNKDISNSNSTDYQPNLGPLVIDAFFYDEEDNKKTNTPVEAEPHSRIDVAENDSQSPSKP